jgi:cytochrome c oxidase cbb3-type subunit 1
MHWPLVVRMIGGMFFVSGVVIMVFNVVMTILHAKSEQAALEAKIAAKMAKAGA